MPEIKNLIKAYDLRNKNYNAAYIVGLIGILSVVNCVFSIFEYDFSFIAGLGIITAFQAMVFGIVPYKYIAMASASVVIVSIASAGYMVYLGMKIAQAEKSAYITAFIIYSLDTLLLFYFSEFLGVVIHIIFLWSLYTSYQESKELYEMRDTLEKLEELLDDEEEDKYNCRQQAG